MEVGHGAHREVGDLIEFLDHRRDVGLSSRHVRRTPQRRAHDSSEAGFSGSVTASADSDSSAEAASLAAITAAALASNLLASARSRSASSAST